VLVGDGERRDEIERAAPPGVTLVGETQDVPAWLAAADVVVQPSRWEGMSLTVLEALAAGRSVVTTDVDGMREALGDVATTRPGAITPVDDLGALVAAVVGRLRDPELVATEERRARARAAGLGLGPWGDAIADATAAVMRARAEVSGARSG
jgi:glycosyltransferase involved in cell wall biosynthesis